MAEFACSAIGRFADRTYLTKLGHAILLNFRFANPSCKSHHRLPSSAVARFALMRSCAPQVRSSVTSGCPIR